MNLLSIAQSNLLVSPIILGLMRISSLTLKEAEELIATALEAGINHFDHADIYGDGECERIFGQVLKMHPDWRKKMIIQDKVGIVRGKMYDFSKTHILNAVDGCLERLDIASIDILLLHRPDALVEPDEVAEVFDQLARSGKVRYFGVSNHTPMQIDLLRTFVKQPMLVNQLQWSLLHTGLTDSGIHMNNYDNSAICRDGYVLDYSRINRMTIQAWSPLQHGFFEGVFVDNDKFPELNLMLTSLSEKYDVTPAAIAIAWLLRHPASTQAIVGTTKSDRLKAIAKASDIYLTREEWYDLYKAAGHKLP